MLKFLLVPIHLSDQLSKWQGLLSKFNGNDRVGEYIIGFFSIGISQRSCVVSMQKRYNLKSISSRQGNELIGFHSSKLYP